MSFRLFALALAAALAFAAPASAHSVKVGSLELTDLWTRATPPGAPTAAGYLTITNTGKESDTLVSASSPDAATTELHIMEVKDGVMSMHPVDGGITVPPGAVVTLAPGGYHLMFVTLKAPLKEGDKFPVTLVFDKGGKVDTFLHIKAIGADGPGDMSTMQHEGN